MPPRLTTRPGSDTSDPLIWLLVTIGVVLLSAVSITGIIVFAVYMIYQPRLPYVKIADAHLNRLNYDQSGLLSTELAIAIVAENDNARAHASFSGIEFLLQFQGTDIAKLRADSFDVPKNSSVQLSYTVPSSPIPLDEAQMNAMDAALHQDRVPFMLEGQARTRWRIGVFGSVKFWTHLSCRLLFSHNNGSNLGPGCSSKSH